MSNSPTDRIHTKFPDITVPSFTDDGRRLHRFRQSSLKDIDICLRRAQFEMTGTMPKVENDAANVGTACHAGFELALQGLMYEDCAYGLSAIQDVAQDELSELILSPQWRWVKFDQVTARRFINQVLAAWYRLVLPELQPTGLEVTFGPLVLHEDDQRVIEVTGTIDYLDAAAPMLRDWKTGSRKHEPWEHERWDMQPSLYTWAAHQMGLVEPDANGVIPFEFIVFWRKNHSVTELQRYTVQRHQGDWDWVTDKAISVAELIEASYVSPEHEQYDMGQWPANDNHALCSPTWCPAWDQCKGKNYAPSWPRPTRPR